jgi:hypothetical protein
MAKRTKSVQGESSRNTGPGGGETRNTSAADDRSPKPSASRGAIKTGDRASSTALAESDRSTVDVEDSERAESDSRERISARAYELYLERGGAHGRDTDDWLEAEREVSRGFDRPTDD